MFWLQDAARAKPPQQRGHPLLGAGRSPGVRLPQRGGGGGPRLRAGALIQLAPVSSSSSSC